MLSWVEQARSNDHGGVASLSFPKLAKRCGNAAPVLKLRFLYHPFLSDPSRCGAVRETEFRAARPAFPKRFANFGNERTK